MIDNQNGKKKKKIEAVKKVTITAQAVSTLTWTQLAESAPFRHPGSPGPRYSMGWYLSAWHWMATHTLLFNLYDLHVTRRAQCPQWCLSEMAGVAPSQQGFIQQVLFGPLILSEMWVIGSKSIICFERCRESSRGYINCICKETKVQLCYIICSNVLYCSNSNRPDKSFFRIKCSSSDSMLYF